MTIRAPKDFWSGVMFCGFAAVALLAARGYALGTAGKMGPGYFPLLLGLVLAGLGLLLIGRSLVLDGEPVPRLHLLPIAVIAFAVALFGLMIEPLGLVVIARDPHHRDRVGGRRSFAWSNPPSWRWR